MIEHGFSDDEHALKADGSKVQYGQRGITPDHRKERLAVVEADWPVHGMEDLKQRENWVNHLCDKFFNRTMNLYLQYLSFLRTDMTQVVGILPLVRQGHAYFT